LKRVFVIVLDSLGIGEMPDAEKFGDTGSNTLRSLFETGKLCVPNLSKLGLFNIDGINYGERVSAPLASYGRMTEKSAAKDTTAGHWEIMGLISEKAFPVYSDGFPDEIISSFERSTGRKVVCNKPYSGTDVILDYGREHEKTGALIVYTSSDSVFQIAAHESVVSVDELYSYCETARNILTGEHAVGRVIARPFTGNYPNYIRTKNRHDFSLCPPKKTALDYMKESDLDVISIGKINDIFAGHGITEKNSTSSNDDGMQKTIDYTDRAFVGIVFTNLVDFDSSFGHRNNVSGYVDALNAFDKQLGMLLGKLKDEDVLFITADHGCDPSTPSTDHSREYTPLIVYGKNIKSVDLKTRSSFADIGKTILDAFNIENDIAGNSFLSEIVVK